MTAPERQPPPNPTSNTLVIRYSAPFHEADLALSRDAARTFADILARGEGELAADTSADPKPYEQLLDAVRVTTAADDDKVVLAIDPDGRALRITGALEHLAVLADVVRDLADDPDLEAHVHVEYFEDHYYLAASEVAIVLRIVG